VQLPSARVPVPAPVKCGAALRAFLATLPEFSGSFPLQRFRSSYRLRKASSVAMGFPSFILLLPLPLYPAGTWYHKENLKFWLSICHTGGTPVPFSLPSPLPGEEAGGVEWFLNRGRKAIHT